MMVRTWDRMKLERPLLYRPHMLLLSGGGRATCVFGPERRTSHGYAHGWLTRRAMIRSLSPAREFCGVWVLSLPVFEIVQIRYGLPCYFLCQGPRLSRLGRASRAYHFYRRTYRRLGRRDRGHQTATATRSSPTAHAAPRQQLKRRSPQAHQSSRHGRHGGERVGAIVNRRRSEPGPSTDSRLRFT
jgi:hypothetical protein